jgi:hypothetical protein
VMRIFDSVPVNMMRYSIVCPVSMIGIFDGVNCEYEGMFDCGGCKLDGNIR